MRPSGNSLRFVFSLFFLTCLSLTSALVVTLPHPCTLVAGSRRCHCQTLWDSDCYCRSKNGTLPPPLKTPICAADRCEVLQRQCWNYQNTYEQLGMSDCPRPYVKRIPVEVIASSKSDTSALLVTAFKGLLEPFADDVDFNLYFTIDNNGGNITSVRGDDDVLGDLYQVCAMERYPSVEDYFPFIVCLNHIVEAQFNFRTSKTMIQHCAYAHGLNFTSLERCVTNGQGKDLLIKSSKTAFNIDRWSQVPSVTMDGRVYNPRAGKDTQNIIAALCYVFHHPSDNISFPWWVFAFMLAIAFVVVLMFWVIRGGRSMLGNVICRTFFDIPEEDDEVQNAADEALRRWQNGELARSFSGDESSNDENIHLESESHEGHGEETVLSTTPTSNLNNAEESDSSSSSSSSSEENYHNDKNDTWSPADEVDVPLISIKK